MTRRHVHMCRDGFVVAARSGLGTAANLRARVRRETGLSPSDYRRRFGPAAGEP